MNTKYILYARKSSESEDRQVQSIDDQVRILKAKAKTLGLEISGVVTESKSAKTPNARPLFNAMMEKVENGEADGIMAWAINRLSRNPVDSARVQWLLQEGRLKSIMTFDREYKPDDNALLFSVESGIANQFIIDLRKSTMRGTQSKLERGGVPYRAPQGYINDRDDGVPKRDPDRYHLIRKMWDMLLSETYTVTQIATVASQEWGYRTRMTKRTGGKELATSTLFKIFTSPFYAGLIPYGDDSFEGNHEAMISLDEYDRAQVILGKRGKPRPQKHAYPYTGIIRCGECGCMFTAEEKRKKLATGVIKTYIYYHCTNKKRGVKCSQRKVMTTEHIEQLIEQGISKFEIRPEFKDWALEILNEDNDREIEERTKIYETQQRRLIDAEREMDNLIRMRYREQVSEEFYLSEKRELEAQILRLKDRLKHTEGRASEWRKLTEETFTLATTARTAFRKGDSQTKRNILMAIGANHVMLGGELFIEAHSWLKPIEERYPAVEAEFLLARTATGKKISLKEAKKGALAPLIKTWYRWSDSNRHGLPHTILSRACLPFHHSGILVFFSI